MEKFSGCLPEPIRETFAESVLELFVELTDFYEVRDLFYLTGGTALSGFHLGHRVSYDIDMFTWKDLLQLEMGEIALMLRSHFGRRLTERVEAKSSFWSFYVDNVKIDMLVDLEVEKDKLCFWNGRMIASPELLLEQKLGAFFSRTLFQVLVDIFFIVDTFDLDMETLMNFYWKASRREAALEDIPMSIAILSYFHKNFGKEVETGEVTMLKPIDLDKFKLFLQDFKKVLGQELSKQIKKEA